MRNPLSTEAFIDWLDKAPETPFGQNVSDCAFARYLRHLGFEAPEVGAFMWCAEGVGSRVLPWALVGDYAASAHLTARTYGELAYQLRRTV